MGLSDSFSSPGPTCLQVSFTIESLLSHPSVPRARPPPPRPEVYLALFFREHSSWITLWRREPCQTGLPNRSQAPLLGLLAMTLGASSSAHEKEGDSLRSSQVQQGSVLLQCPHAPASPACSLFPNKVLSPTCLPLFPCCTFSRWPFPTPSTC